MSPIEKGSGASKRMFTRSWNIILGPRHEFRYWILPVAFIIAVEATSQSQATCFPCEEVSAKLGTVEANYRSVGEGFKLLEQTRGDLRKDEMAANAVSATYIILESVSVSLGVELYSAK